MSGLWTEGWMDQKIPLKWLTKNRWYKFGECQTQHICVYANELKLYYLSPNTISCIDSSCLGTHSGAHKRKKCVQQFKFPDKGSEILAGLGGELSQFIHVCTLYSWQTQEKCQVKKTNKCECAFPEQARSDTYLLLKYELPDREASVQALAHCPVTSHLWSGWWSESLDPMILTYEPCIHSSVSETATLL